MKPNRLTLLAWVLFILFPLKAAAEVIDRIVASVGDDAITLYDVEKEGAPLFQQIRVSSPPGEYEERLSGARKKVLDGLIEKMLLVREARKMGISVGEEDVEAAISRVKSENKISEEQLVKALEKEGLTFEQYRKEISGQMLRARVIDRKVKGSVDVSDADILAYYEENDELFARDSEVRVRHILFSVPADADESSLGALRKKMIEVLQMARKGEDFAELAKKYSQGPSAPMGGDLGFFKKGDMVKEFSDAAFSLKEGEISPPVRSSFGFHIIKMIERRGGELISLDEVREEIRMRLFNEALEKGIAEYIREIRETGDVRVFL